MEAEWIHWKGRQAVRLTGGGYEAIVLPDFGANCISLIHQPSGSQLLRVPKTQEQLREGCNVYGLPLLFPPNRLRDGRFDFEGRTYAFPINESERGNHIHGFLSQTAFAYEGGGSFLYEATEADGYLNFPHAFSVRREYALGGEGLVHTVTVTNHSRRRMPLGVGIHAALRAERCRLQMEPLCRWVVDPARMLPTGERIWEEPLLTELRNGTLDPEAQPLSALLECRPGSEIALRGENGTWCCTPAPSFRFFMLWNGGGGGGFVCPEPQSWVTDAPHLPLPAETKGFRALSPGEEARFEVRYHYNMKE